MDIRKEMYETYTSQYKVKQCDMNEKRFSSFLKGFEYKYLPLFRNIIPSAAILELGCGIGYFLQFLNIHGFVNNKGIDISKEQIEIAIESGVDATEADVFHYLNGRMNEFDVIVAIDFLEHFHKEELIPLIRLIFDSIASRGFLILQTPNGQGLFPHQVIHGDLTHFTVLTPTSLMQLLKPAGFREFHFYETGPMPINIKGLLRVVLWSIIKILANTIRKTETRKKQRIWTESMICVCRKPE